MPITVYNTKYRDDFLTQDSNGKTPADKNYMRILFKPGTAVQTREINQLQSILQTQISHLGTSIFQNGRAVIEGRVNFDKSGDVYSIDISRGTPLPPGVLETIGAAVRNDTETGEIQYSLVVFSKYLGLNETGDSHLYRLYIKNVESEARETENIQSFVVGDVINLYDNSEVDTFSSKIPFANFDVISVGRAVGAKIEKGVYYILGNFVYVDDQYFAVDIGDNELFSGEVILGVEEKIITAGSGVGPNEDNSLYDNAQGFPNFAAAGADRYCIDLTLDIRKNNDNLDNQNYDTVITLMRIQNNTIVTNISLDSTAGLDDKFAQRTYEESGNYEVNPFVINVREAYREIDPPNGGFARTDEELQSLGYNIGDTESAKNDLVVQIQPSTAYVKGHRVELLDTLALRIGKSRDIFSQSNLSVSANYGNYVEGTLKSGSGLPAVTNPNFDYDLQDSSNTKIGTTKIKSIEYIGNEQYRLFLFDIRLNAGSVFRSVRTIVGSPVTGLGTFQFDVPAGSRRFDSSNEPMLFPLPKSPTVSVSNLSYIRKESHINIPVTSVTVNNTTRRQINISASGGIISKNFTDSFLFKTGSGARVLIPNVDYTVNFNTPADQITYTFTAADIAVGNQISVLISVERVATQGIKTLVTKTIDYEDLIPVLINGVNANKEFIIPNVYHLFELVGDSSDVFEIVFDGQLPSSYSNARIKFKDPDGLDPETVTFSHFELSSSGEYFAADSYIDERDPTTPRQLNFDEFPKNHFSNFTLYDVIDFRQHPNNTQRSFANPWSALKFNLSYYVGRVDTIAVNSLGNFYIKSGIPSDNPRPPRTDDDSMGIYNITLNPYTFNEKDIVISKIDNKRYTMSNIRTLEKRIGNLEKYTTLSLLEKSALDISLYDDDLGRERFKNGFLVDNFTGHGVGDVNYPGYTCAVDPNKNTLRPAFTTRSLKLELSEVGSLIGDEDFANNGVHTKALTLPYNEKEYIFQSRATSDISVNPQQFGVTIGNVDLYPSSDHWIDVAQRPASLTRSIDFRPQILSEGEDSLGSEWNSWERYWAGETNSLLRTPWFDQTQSGPDVPNSFASDYDISKDINNALESIETSSNTRPEERTVGDKIINLTLLPYIRSRYIYFKATGLKPNTRYFSFFDGNNVQSYTYSIRKTHFDLNKNNDIASISGALLPNISDLFIGFNVYTNDEDPNELITDENGTLYGLFVIPNASDGFSFTAGAKKFRLIDTPRNINFQAKSYADGTYVVAGLIDNEENSIITTGIVENVQSSISDSTVLTSKSVNTRKKNSHWGDPIAQSIFINNPEGIFATSVDLYFKNGAEDYFEGRILSPIEIYLVPTQNGIPSQSIIPFTRVSTQAENVEISVDGTKPTRFTFDQPVYLAPGQEYAIVISSNDPNYSVYVCRVGEKDLVSDEKITKNPFDGVFFKSQGGSLWIPEPHIDLKFKLNRAEFNTAQRTVSFETKVNSRVESIELINTGGPYTSSPDITIIGESSTQAKARAILDGAGGIARIEIVPSLSEDGQIVYGGEEYTSTPAVTITNGGLINTDNPATAIAKMPDFGVSSFYLSQDSILINTEKETGDGSTVGTSIINDIEILNESYQIQSGLTYNATSSKYSWDFPGISANNPVRVRSRLSSTSNYISPLIDLERHSVKIIKNYIRAEGDLSSSYITRQVRLRTPSDKLDIYLDLNRPTSDAIVKVFAQFKFDATGTDDIVQSDWIEIPSVYPREIPVNANSEIYSEIHYSIDPLEDFSEFRVKIDFYGNNIIDIPTIKKFRAIASI